MDLAYFQPVAMPPEVEAYGRELRQLPVGSPGKTGGLKLRFAKDHSGKTILKDVWRQMPLQTLRPFYYDPSQPGLAIVYLLNPTGGTLQGDRLRVDVDLEAGTRVHLTTQAANKIYRMNADYATHTTNLILGEGSFLEYLPDQTIPYRDSRYYQEVNVTMHRNSSFMYWEIVTAGRDGREHFDFDILYSKLQVEDDNGDPLLSDNIVLEPKSSAINLQGVMGRYSVLGNFYVLSDKAGEEVVEAVRNIPQKRGTLQGVGPTPMARGLVARVLGPSARVVRSCLEKIWNETRIEVLGSPAPKIRK